MNVIDSFTQFLKDQSDTDLVQRTLDSYVSQMRTMENTYKLDLENPSETNVLQVLRDMEKNLSTSSMNYRRIVLRYWLSFNSIEPSETLKQALKSKRVKKKKKLHPEDLLTFDEVLDIVKHTENPALRAFSMVLWDTGRRPSGVTRLNVGDVTPDKHGYVLTFKRTKTEQSRRPVRLLVPKAISFFEQWWAIHPQQHTPNAPLFLNQRGKRMKANHITIWLKDQHEKRLGRGTDAPKAPLNAYLFRKSRATQLLKEGQLSEIQIKMRLGHKKDSNMLEKYYAIIDEMDQAKAELAYMGIEKEEDKHSQPILCPSCGSPNEPDASKCQRCKHPFTESALIEARETTVAEADERVEVLKFELKEMRKELATEQKKNLRKAQTALLSDPETLDALIENVASAILRKQRRGKD